MRMCVDVCDEYGSSRHISVCTFYTVLFYTSNLLYRWVLLSPTRRITRGFLTPPPDFTSLKSTPSLWVCLSSPFSSWSWFSSWSTSAWGSSAGTSTWSRRHTPTMPQLGHLPGWTQWDSEIFWPELKTLRGLQSRLRARLPAATLSKWWTWSLCHEAWCQGEMCGYKIWVNGETTGKRKWKFERWTIESVRLMVSECATFVTSNIIVLRDFSALSDTWFRINSQRFMKYLPAITFYVFGKRIFYWMIQAGIIHVFRYDLSILNGHMKWWISNFSNQFYVYLIPNKSLGEMYDSFIHNVIITSMIIYICATCTVNPVSVYVLSACFQ